MERWTLRDVWTAQIATRRWPPAILPAPPPAEAATWRKSLEAARVDDAVYAKVLAAVLKTLVCSGDDHAGFLFIYASARA